MKMILGCFVTLILVLSTGSLYAQIQGQPLIDSLLKELPRQKEDTNKVNLLDAIANAFGESYPDESIKYDEKEIELSEKINWKKGMGEGYAHLADDYRAKDSFSLALRLMLKSIDIFEQLDNKQYIAHEQLNIADLYQSKRLFDTALRYYEKALMIYDTLNDREAHAYMLLCIGNIHMLRLRYHDALTYCYQVLKTAESFSPARAKMYIAATEGVMGKAYLGIAQDTTGAVRSYGGKMASLDSAIKYLERGIAGDEAGGDIGNVINFSSALADAWVAAGNYKKAFETIEHMHVLQDSVTQKTAREDRSVREMFNEMNESKVRLEDKQLQTEKRNRVLLVAGIGLLLLLVVFILRNYNNQLRSNKVISKEKKRSEDLLLNILPAEVAEELKSTGASEARQFNDVTVLFTDFVSFTETSERLTPKELVKELDNCFKAFDEITSKYQIEKIKTIGDAYLAVCGLPVTNPRHAEHTVAAAKEINAFMDDRYLKFGNGTFRIRIGIHSGSVVAGIVGVKKFAYDIWGDTVNTAARMEQNSEAGKINISEATYELVKEKFSCEYRGEIEAKGKGAMKMYYVI